MRGEGERFDGCFAYIDVLAVIRFGKCTAQCYDGVPYVCVNASFTTKAMPSIMFADFIFKDGFLLVYCRIAVISEYSAFSMAG